LVCEGFLDEKTKKTNKKGKKLKTERKKEWVKTPNFESSRAVSATERRLGEGE